MRHLPEAAVSGDHILASFGSAVSQTMRRERKNGKVLGEGDDKK